MSLTTTQRQAQQVVFFKLAVTRFLLSLIGLSSLLGNWQYSNWQGQTLASAMVYFALFSFAILMGLGCTLGVRTNWTLPAFAWSIILLQLIGPLWFRNGFFIHAQVFVAFALLILNISCCDRYLSFSSLSSSSPNLPSLSEARMAEKWFQYFILCYYALCAFEKLRLSFLSGFSLEANLLEFTFGSLPLPFAMPAWVFRVLAVSAMAVEFSIPLLLWWGRKRTLVITGVIFFHLTLFFFLHAPWLSLALPFSMIMFVDDRRLMGWLGIAVTADLHGEDRVPGSYVQATSAKPVSAYPSISREVENRP